MASSMISTASVATRSNPAQATMVAPFTGLKSTSAFPVTKKFADITTLPTNGGRVQCMQVWPPLGKLKYETLSYLPDLTEPQLIKQVEYLLRNGWIPCIEFELENGLPHRHYHASPGYYDGRYWVMWKLPMFGCTDATQVVKEIKELEKEYPDCWARVIGFDKIRQVQCVSFTVKRPKEDKRPLPSANEILLTNNFWSLTHPFATKFGDTPTFTDWKSGHY